MQHLHLESDIQQRFALLEEAESYWALMVCKSETGIFDGFFMLSCYVFILLGVGMEEISKQSLSQ